MKIRIRTNPTVTKGSTKKAKICIYTVHLNSSCKRNQENFMAENKINVKSNRIVLEALFLRKSSL